MKGETARLSLRYEPLTRASERTGLSVQDLRRFIANGQLKAYRCGARIIRVDTREVDSLGVECGVLGGGQGDIRGVQGPSPQGTVPSRTLAKR